MKAAAEFDTSIGKVRVAPRDYDAIEISTELGMATFPSLYIVLVRTGDDWKLDPADSPQYCAGAEAGASVPPPALIDELVTLGRDWALSHSEDIEAYSRSEYESWRDGLEITLTGLTGDLEIAEEELGLTLNDVDFARLASPELRTRVEQTREMLRAMTLQVETAAELIREETTR